MSELAGGAELLNEFRPISQANFYSLQIAESKGDFDSAVSSIDNPQDALNFSAGFANLEEMYGHTDYIYSGRYALALIGASLERQLGPGVSDIKDMWRGALKSVIFGKETPGIWQYLVDGTDLKAVDLETIEFSEEESHDASLAFKEANERLVQISSSFQF